MYRLGAQGNPFLGECAELEQVSVCVGPVGVWLIEHRQHTEEFVCVMKTDCER